MEFSFSDKNKIGVYSLSGNLIGEADGIAMTESFSEKLELGYEHFVIDLSDLQHINSSGLGVLITLLTKARKKGGELMLANPSSYIKNLLLITKLNTIFDIHASTEEALGAFVK
ncbi:MAG: STAS domain-containing protein [Bacteroidota bacterium]